MIISDRGGIRRREQIVGSVDRLIGVKDNGEVEKDILDGENICHWPGPRIKDGLGLGLIRDWEMSGREIVSLS